MTYIRSQNGAGDILGQFYNTNGDLLELSHHNRLIGTPLSILRNMKHVVGVAGGTEKIDAIYGALKGKFIHSLITDEETVSPYYERMVIVNVPFISFRCWYREHSSSSF